MAVNKIIDTIKTFKPHWVVAAIFGVAGVGHFVAPKQFEKIVPPQVPGSAHDWTIASGVGELALAAGFLSSSTRKITSRYAIAFLIAVWPANFYMAQQWENKALPLRALVYGRLPFQLPLIYLAYLAGKNTPAEQDSIEA